jgi:outer membrane lipoprotein
MKRTLVLLAGLLWILSCAPFSKSLMDQADPSLTFGEVQKNPDAFLGKTVVWGGVIVETLNRRDETLVKVRLTDLDADTRPRNTDRSPGRFIIRYPGFLDPAIYRKGREITAAGEITGKEVLPLGNLHYVYSVVTAKEIHLWEKMVPYPPYYYPYYYDPFYPWWWHRPYWRHPYWW